MGIWAASGPLAYLQFARFSALPNDLQITPVPVVFGALARHWGHLGPAEIPEKNTDGQGDRADPRCL